MFNSEIKRDCHIISTNKFRNAYLLLPSENKAWARSGKVRKRKAQLFSRNKTRDQRLHDEIKYSQLHIIPLTISLGAPPEPTPC